MKRILIALAMLVAVQVADAQVKTANAAKKAVQSAEVASQDPKKATKVATWLKLAKAYMDAYNSPKGNASNLVGMGVTNQEVMLTLAGEKPLKEENIEVSGEPCVKQVYETREYIYNRNGQFIAINVTKPLFEDPLAEALKAYVKAYEVDVKQSKLDDIKAGIDKIAKAYLEDGITAYTLGDNLAASALFAKSGEASATAPFSQVNGEAFYNAGYTALAANEPELAKSYFEKCLAYNYYHEGGDVYSKLASIYDKYAQVEEAKGKEISVGLAAKAEELRELEAKVQNLTEQEARVKLNESDIIAKGRRATKQDLANKAKFAEERAALAESIAQANAQIEVLKKEVEEASAVVAKYNEAAQKEREVSRDILEQGFAKFPQSQSILIGLINYYIASGQEPTRLFELIDLAKKNEPNNASLYYVEGNIYKQLGQIEKAAEAYGKCAEINPEYEFGFVGAGLLYYDEAVKAYDAAAKEYDDAKYAVLAAQCEQLLHDAIEPFEKAFNLTKDEGLKVSIAEYLKSIYYRFYSKGAEYEAGYNKYNDIVKASR